MKFLLLFSILLVLAPAFAEPISDRTGLKTSFGVSLDGKTYTIETVANFDIKQVDFEDGKIVFNIMSSLKNNLAELQIPQNITKGQTHFFLDGSEISPKVLKNDKISFVTLEFPGNGTHTLEVTSDLGKQAEQPQSENKSLDPVATSAAAIGIVIAIGAGSTLAFYMKRKKHQ